MGLCQNARMDAIAENAITRIRHALAELEQQLGEAAPRLPGSVPWLTLDENGHLLELTEPAGAALGLDVDAVGGVLADRLVLEGDPLRGGLIRAHTASGELPLFSVPQEKGACLIVGSDDPGGAMDRRLVHDLANVLAVVRGRAEMASLDEVPERVVASMKEIITAVDRARDLLGD
ncbi:MAG: hypothetical protein EA417_16890 [Gammaproteobacteria bacterium]|nr:MAG: hypothetical protein EA417_16890 [Gammaproteobacteria bacterium]